MEEGYYKKLWWEIILATLGFSVIPLVILGAVIYQQFSASYSAKIMENMKTLAENRSASIDLFFDERISQLTGLAQTNSLEQLSNEDYLHKVFNIIQARSKSFLDLGVIDQEGNHLAYVGPLCILASVLVSLMELLVAALQAYIFTFLTAIFIGLYMEPAH